MAWTQNPAVINWALKDEPPRDNTEQIHYLIPYLKSLSIKDYKSKYLQPKYVFPVLFI